MARSVTTKLWKALTLNQNFYRRIGNTAANRRLGFLIVLMAGISHSLGSVIILIVNRANLLTLGWGFLIHSALVVAGYYFWSFTIWKLVKWLKSDAPRYGHFLSVIGLAYTPQIFNFLTVIPLLGRPIQLGLAIWSLLAVILAVHPSLNLKLIWTSLICLLGWPIVNIGTGVVQIVEQWLILDLG